MLPSFIVYPHANPKNRLYAYLAVDVGSLNESDNQQGVRKAAIVPEPVVILIDLRWLICWSTRCFWGLKPLRRMMQ